MLLVKFAKKLHHAAPGRLVRESYKKRAIPPLWVWLRSFLFVTLGFFLIVFGFNNIATILFTFAVVQLLAVSVAAFCQELANGIKRYLKI